MKCVARKLPQERARAAMQKYQVGLPMERVAIDVMGQFSHTNQGEPFRDSHGRLFYEVGGSHSNTRPGGTDDSRSPIVLRNGFNKF